MNNVNIRLPIPRGKPSARALAALRTYERMDKTEGFRRQRILSTRLTMLLEEMSVMELAHYYKGVQAYLKAIPTADYKDGFIDA